MGSCRVYCSLCLDIEYSRGFIPNRQLVVSINPLNILDDIIHTAQGLLNANNRTLDILGVNNDSEEDSDLDIEDVD